MSSRVSAAAAEIADAPAAPTSARAAWLMAVAAMVGVMCCSTSVVVTSTGLFLKPMVHDFGWTRGAFSAALTIAGLGMAVVNPFVGRLIDRVGVKPVLIASLVIYGAATAAIPYLSHVFGLWGFYVGYLLIGAGGAGSNVIAYLRLLTGWFSGDLAGKRGLALGISTAGIPLGSAIAGPVSVALISGGGGWQAGFFGLAAFPILLGLPLAIFAIRLAPEARLAAARGAAPGVPGASLAEASRLRAFWLLIVIAFIMALCLGGQVMHMAPVLSDRGIRPGDLALVAAALGLLGVVGRIGAGHMFDRWFAPYVAVGIFAALAGAMLALAGPAWLSLAVTASIVVGLGSGAESDFIGYVVGRYFGLRAYGAIFGVVYGVFKIGMAISPLLFGFAYDHWGDYRVPYLAAAAGLTLLCALLLFLPRYGRADAAPAPPATTLPQHGALEAS